MKKPENRWWRVEVSSIGKALAFVIALIPATNGAFSQETTAERSLNGGQSTMEMGEFLQKTVSLPQNMWEQMRPSREELVHILREDVGGYTEFIYSVDGALEGERDVLMQRIEDDIITFEEVATYIDSIDEMTTIIINLRSTAIQILTQLENEEDLSVISNELDNRYYPLARELSAAKTSIREERGRLLFRKEPSQEEANL